MLDGQDFTSSQSLRISLSELTMSYGQFCVSNRDSWRRLALAVKSAWQQKELYYFARGSGYRLAFLIRRYCGRHDQ